VTGPLLSVGPAYKLLARAPWTHIGNRKQRLDISANVVPYQTTAVQSRIDWPQSR